MPPIRCSAWFSVSTWRSSISRSVTTVTDCGMSRCSCRPRPTLVVVARSEVASVSGLPVTAMAGIVVSRPAGAAVAAPAAGGAAGAGLAASAAGAVAAGLAGACTVVAGAPGAAGTWASACACIRPKPAASAPSGSSRRGALSSAVAGRRAALAGRAAFREGGMLVGGMRHSRLQGGSTGWQRRACAWEWFGAGGWRAAARGGTSGCATQIKAAFRAR